MTNTIMDSGNMAEIQEDWDGPQQPQSNLVAAHEPEGIGMEFHVSMRDYTLRDMETMIIEAAAQQIIGKFGNERLAKAIEERCIILINEKATTALAKVTDEIIDQPVTTRFGDKKPVTMREFIGLTGREYLAELVDNTGKVNSDNYNRHVRTRMQYLIGQAMERKFLDEITKSTNAVIVSVQREVKSALDQFLIGEKARLSAAIAKVATP